MKIKTISLEQAKEILLADKYTDQTKNWFLGSLEECWDKAKENGFKGSIPVFRLDGSVFKDNDAGDWDNAETVLVNKQGNAWYQLLDVKADYKLVKTSEFENSIFYTYECQNAGTSNKERIYKK